MYEAKTWAKGDLITSAALNHIEQGIANEQVGPAGPKGDKGDPGADAVLAAATADAIGGVKLAAAVADAADGADAAALRTTINALLASLRAAGTIAE